MKDLTGLKFGKLKVVEFARKNDCTTFWFCECECGNKKTVCRNNLISGHCKSCGCLKHKKYSENKGWLGVGDISLRTWTLIKRKAEERDLGFEISIEDAWKKYQEQNGKCALTGWTLTLLSPKGNYSNKTASLDRINSDLGYISGNIQWVHKDVNAMKSWFSNERFIEVCEAVTKHGQTSGD